MGPVHDPILDDMLAQEGWTIDTAPDGYVEALKGTLEYQWRAAGLTMSQLWQAVKESFRKNASTADRPRCPCYCSASPCRCSPDGEGSSDMATTFRVWWCQHEQQTIPEHRFGQDYHIRDGVWGRACGPDLQCTGGRRAGLACGWYLLVSTDGEGE